RAVEGRRHVAGAPEYRDVVSARREASGELLGEGLESPVRRGNPARPEDRDAEAAGHRPTAVTPRSQPAPSASAARNVRAGQHLEKVPVGILEVEAAAAVAMVDLVRTALHRIRPVREPAVPDAREDAVELALADEERVVL